MATEETSTAREAEEKPQGLFDKDPLLLKLDSQHEYGDRLLHNLVIARPLSICVPAYADLHSSSPKPEKRTPPPPPSPELRTTYLRARIKREEIRCANDKKELEKRTMLARGERTLDRLPNEEGVYRYGEDSRVRGALHNRLRIAAVGFRVKISKVTDNGYFDENLCPLSSLPEIGGLPDSRELNELRRTKPLSQEAEGWTTTIHAHIDAALRAGSHIVVLPEFSLPPSTHGTSIIRRIIASSKSAGPTDASSKNDHFIFAGSRHEGGYNRGLVVQRKDGALGMKWHYKTASARGLGENVLASQDERQWSYPVHVIHSDGKHLDINVMVAICYDAYDPTTFLNLILHNAKQIRDNQERLIIVPSFNPSSEFVEMLRDLSFLASCPVLYVDGLHGEARMFISGIAVRDLNVDGRISAHLTREIDELSATLQQRRRTLREAERNDPGYRQMEGERLATTQLESTIDKLQTLQDSLSALQSSGRLANLISVEDCALCRDESHEDDYNCRHDILYYNIDMHLVRILTKFRKTFFQESRFLPKPLRADSLSEAAVEMEKRRRRRVEREAE